MVFPDVKKLNRLLLLALFILALVPVLGACGEEGATGVPAAGTPTQGVKANSTTPPVTGTTAATAFASDPKARQEVTIALSYIPDVQFAPLYVAQDKGYFTAEGLSVKFQYGAVTDLMALVAQGKIPFALTSGDEVIQARAGAIPVTYLATFYQKYPVALASPKGKGITKLGDLKGKTVGIPGQFGSTYIGLKAILAAAKLSEDDLKIETIGFTQREALAQGKVDGAMVYSMNEPVQLQKAGTPLDVIEVSGLASLASIGLITGESLLSSNPQLVQKVVRAVTRGIKDTLDNPDSAFESTVKVEPDAKGKDPDLQKQVLKETVKFMNAENVKGQVIGYINPGVWEKTAQFLLDTKLIRNKVDPVTAYTNKFLAPETGKYN